MIHEIKQVIWLDTPRGLALAKFLVDRGVDSDFEWVTVLNDTGQVLSFDNSEVLVTKSFTLGRRVGWEDFNYPPFGYTEQHGSDASDGKKDHE